MLILIAIAGRSNVVAEALSEALTARGAEVVRLSPLAVEQLARFDAVVVGSAVYLGRWLPSARSLLERCAAELRHKPLWLISSGWRDVPDGTADGAEPGSPGGRGVGREDGGALGRRGGDQGPGAMDQPVRAVAPPESAGPVELPQRVGSTAVPDAVELGVRLGARRHWVLPGPTGQQLLRLGPDVVARVVSAPVDGPDARSALTGLVDEIAAELSIGRPHGRTQPTAVTSPGELPEPDRDPA